MPIHSLQIGTSALLNTVSEVSQGGVFPLVGLMKECTVSALTFRCSSARNSSVQYSTQVKYFPGGMSIETVSPLRRGCPCTQFSPPAYSQWFRRDKQLANAHTGVILHGEADVFLIRPRCRDHIAGFRAGQLGSRTAPASQAGKNQQTTQTEQKRTILHAVPHSLMRKIKLVILSPGSSLKANLRNAPPH